MNQKTTILASLAAIGLLATASAGAQITQGWGVHVRAASVDNCINGGCNGSFSETAPVGGEFATSATVANNTHGRSWATASFAAGATYLPELKTYAESALGKAAFAVAFGSQGFRYSGATTAEITLNINLTSAHSRNDNGYASSDTTALIAVLRTNQLPWDPRFSAYTAEGGVPAEDRFTANLFVNASGFTQSTGSLNFTIESGQDFYVMAALVSGAQNGIADASNTLVMNFADATGLTAVSAVPEPHAAVLLLAGLAGLGIAAKRRGA
jgi:hypothetical protein